MTNRLRKASGTSSRTLFERPMGVISQQQGVFVGKQIDMLPMLLFPAIAAPSAIPNTRLVTLSGHCT